MTRSIVVQPASVSHVHLMAVLHEASFPSNERWDMAALSALLVMPGTLGWIALSGASPAGFLLIRHCAEEAEVLTLAVHPQFRRQGVASVLLRTGCFSLRSIAVDAVFLEVSVNNNAAYALYRKEGFVSCGVRRGYYHDGSDANVLRYDL